MLIHLEKLGKSFGEKIVLHDVTASVEREDRIGIVGQNGAGKTTLLKILTGEYQDYEGEFSVTHGVTLGYLEQNAKLDATLDLYGEMRSTFAPVLDAMAQMQVLERKMAAQPDDTELLARHDQLQNIVDAADGYNMDVNIKKVLSGMGFAQDTWQKNIAVLSGGELTRLRLAKLLLEKPDVLILDEPTNHLDFATMEWLENYLKGYSGAVLVVSHDRYFLDNVCTKIWEVSFQTMTTYKGNFSAYLPQKEAADALRQKQHDADVALAGKLLPHTAIFYAMGSAILIVMYGIIGFPLLSGIWPMLLLMLLFVLAAQALGIVMIGLLPDFRLGISFASLWGVISFSISGFTFPVDAMHPVLQSLANLFPLRHYFLVYVDQALNGLPLSYSAGQLAWLAGFCLLPLPLLGRLKNTLQHAKYRI